MEKIIFINQDGSVGVITPTTKALETLSLQQIAQKDVPSGAVSYRIVNASEIPSDRSYRGAWVCDQNHVIGHDLVKAKELHKDKLRALRAPKLAKLDIEYQKADELSDSAKKQEVAAKKQALRDITTHESVLNASSIEELKLAVPSVLEE